MSGQTILEINLNNLEKNILFLKSKIEKNTKFLAVVKAFSYGNDHCKIASFLERKKLADYFAVAFCSEGVELRKAGISLPILVFHPQIADFQELTEFQLEPNLYSKRILQSFVTFAKEQQLADYPIHLKCNTGMNRLGFSLLEMPEICEILTRENSVKIKTAFSHLFASEDKNATEFMQKQISLFVDFQAVIKKYFSHQILFHNCNTSGILNFPEAHFDMVRSGIGMYGFANDPELQKNFLPITTLKSIISQIHQIEKGDCVGYNFGFVAEKPMKTATIPAGHADGINRIYGKGAGFVYINGKKAPILGNTCMDMIMVDVSEIPCQEGDEVVIFDEKHTAEQLAENAKTISYELITSLSRRIKRIYIEKS